MGKGAWKCFLAGWVASIGLNMFHQDMLGLDKYLEYLKITWHHISPFWGLAIFVVACIVFAHTKGKEGGE